MGTTLLFATLLAGLITCLALEEKLHAKKSVIAGVFAIVCLFLGEVFHLLPNGPVLIAGHEINLPVYIPAIDWNVIAIILGSSIFVDVTARSGLFTWIALRLTKASGGDPFRLLVAYGIMTVVFSAVLNNVTAMIIVGSLTSVSLKRLQQTELLLGFLMIEGLLTNVGGLLTLISSVPNILVGTAAGIGFVDFFLAASPYVLVATAATLWMGARRFQIKRLSSDAQRLEAAQLVEGFDENDGIESRGFFWFGVIMLVLFIAVIATTSILPFVKDLGMGWVALAFATVMLVRYKAVADRFYQAIDWDLLGFFCALFITINVMEYAGVLELIGTGLGKIIGLGETVGSGLILLTGAAASSVTDNIPLAAMLSKILAVHPEIGSDPDSPFWWSVVFGANLGGNLTPIGSASTLVAVTIMHKQELKVGFGRFVKLALPFAIMQLLLAVGYVLIFLN
jgi:Na+/H+ antiporter NhaD/arsenite permease-like protein